MVHFLTSAVIGLLAVGQAMATEIMHRPSNFKTKLTPNTGITNVTSVGVITESADGKSAELSKRAGAKVNMVYFGNWDIYARNYFPANIPTSKLSHVLYCFADVNPSTGAIVLSDSYADTDKHYDTDSWSDSGNNVYGNFKQLYLLKQANRKLKVSLSIGGWTYSQAGHFDPVVQSASLRSAFVSSAMTMLENFGLDGIDIDYEYPTTDAMASGYSALLTALRSALDAKQASKGDSTPYILTAAVPAGASNYAILAPYVPAINKALTYWNLMAYDYAGSWSTVSDDQANLYSGSASGVDTQDSINWYVSKGADITKITMGMPIYGRAFESTNGIRQSFNGIGPGTWEAGVYDYKALPMAGATVTENTAEGASYSYDSSKKELVTYDTPNIVKLKSNYIISKNMAGAMFWEIAADKTDSNSLVGTSYSTFGSIESSQNHLNYPGSVYDNIKNNMGSGSGSGTTTAKPTTTTTTTKPTTTTAGGGTGSCAGVAAWSSAVAYNGGQDATYGGHLWQAKWWTQADTPGGSAGVWTDLGAC